MAYKCNMAYKITY
uniref:Uncharacterized protein n=1 Tax=Leersia perrieri TaxID=77586 RepID=A0A0D9WER6_9ORYZ